MANASLFSPANPHFFQPLLSGFQSHLKLPVKFFSKHIEGNYEGKTVTLTSDSSERTWKVKMEGHSLTDGWKEFVKAHDLRIGDFVVFRHEGDMLFHVTALGTGFCEILYAPSLSHDKDEESDEIGESSRKEKDLKTESDQSSSDLTCFSLSVTASNLSKAAVGVPVDFARRNGLDKGRHEIVLMNQEGMSWESEVKSSTSGQVFICRNWKSFCTASKLEVGDSFTFQVLQNTKTPVFQLCCRAKVERKKKIQYVHKTQKKKKIQYVQSCDKDDDQDNMRNLSTKQNVTTEPDADDKDNMETESFSSDPSCFVALITISNLGEDRLFLPRKFVRPDGLKKSSNKISLINEEARIWTLILKFRESTRTFNMRSGWRSFCRENGLKPGDSVTFKLERTNTRMPLLRFSSAESKKVSTKYSSKGKRKETGESSQRVSSSSLSSSLSESRFVTLTVTPASFKHCSLYLPKSFTRDNGMENAEGKKVTLLDKHGVEWPVNLVMLKRNRRMHLGSGLKEFLKAIGVKAYKSFVLELVWEDTTSPPMLKFCSMVKT